MEVQFIWNNVNVILPEKSGYYLGVFSDGGVFEVEYFEKYKKFNHCILYWGNMPTPQNDPIFKQNSNKL